MESKLSVLIASDIPMLRDSFSKLLNETDDVEVVACAETPGDAVRLTNVYGPGLVVVDLNIGKDSFRELATSLFAMKTPWLMMSDSTDETEMFELLFLGLCGVIPRRASAEMISKCIRAVASGETWISRQVVSKLVRHAREVSQGRASIGPNVANPSAAARISCPEPTDLQAPNRPPNRFSLTPRELQIVQAIGEAMTNKDIAVSLGISEYTVKHHLTKIFDKLGVYSRLELSMFATHHGLIGTRDSMALVAS